MTDGTQFFHISPDWCGQDKLAELFRLNGHAVALWEGGTLAEDIFYAEAAGSAPLAAYEGYALIGGLYRHTSFWQPPLEAWRKFEYLARHFPHARFILTTRTVDGWLLDRLIRDKGRVARCYAYHLGVPVADLPELWERDWDDHLWQVDTFFGDDPRLIRVDLEACSPEDLARRLAFPLAPAGDWQPPHPAAPEAQLRGILDRGAVSKPADRDYAEDIAQFCLAGLRPDEPGDDAALSPHACLWDGTWSLTTQAGQDSGIRITDDGVAIWRPDLQFKVQRAAGVVNDILRMDRAMKLRIDMEDSRWIGSAQGDVLQGPVLCHNRRVAARNVVLWPLPDVHSIGLPGFDPHARRDSTPFDQKEDAVVWRGMISGSEMRNSVRPGPASHVLLRQLSEAGSDQDARSAAWDALSRTNRLNFVQRYFRHPDFNLGVVMAWGYREFAKDPLLAPYCRPAQAQKFFWRFRYQLCMTGYDHGSNFIPMIDSQSVMLKEEDGWEVFYSDRFKPWKHYIPLERYCADIEEKLAWARENPNQCKEMSAAARSECARLRDPATRRLIMERILDGLAAAG